jgi:hypothetical protein
MDRCDWRRGTCKGGGALRRIGFDKLEGADLRVPIEITFIRQTWDKGRGIHSITLSRDACYYIYTYSICYKMIILLEPLRLLTTLQCSLAHHEFVLCSYDDGNSVRQTSTSIKSPTTYLDIQAV